MPPGSPRVRVALLVAVGLLAGAACAAGITVPATHGTETTADEPQYLLTAVSLATDGDLDIADELTAGRWREFHALPLPEQTKPLAGGRRLSPHGPLLPLLLAVPAAAGGWVAAKLAMATLAGLLAALLLWTAVHRFGVPVPTATLAALVVALSPPLAVYGSQLYPELPAALAVLAAVAALTPRATGNVGGEGTAQPPGPPAATAAPGPPEPPGRPTATAATAFPGPAGRVAATGSREGLGGRAVLVAGVAVVALPWLAVKYVPVAGMLALAAGWRLLRAGQLRRTVALALALAAAAAGFLVLHRWWYGGWTPYAAGDHFVGGELTAVGTQPDYLGRSRRLLGLLVDRTFGLTGWQPAWLLAVPALAVLARRRPPGWTALVLPLAAGWLVATFPALTMHGWWFPGRQVVVVLPLAALALAWWVGRHRRRRLVLAAAGAFGVLAYGWLVVEGAGGRVAWAVDVAATANPLHRAWRLLLPDYLAMTAWTWPLHVAWLLALGAWALAAWRTADRGQGTGATAADSRAGHRQGRLHRLRTRELRQG
jgi:hypothetical protein